MSAINNNIGLRCTVVAICACVSPPVGFVVGAILLSKYIFNSCFEAASVSQSPYTQNKERLSKSPIDFLLNRLKVAARTLPKQRANHSLYFVSNEKNRKATIQILENQKKIHADQSSLYIGVSGTENLNFIALSKAKGALLFDTSIKVMKMWEAFEYAMRTSHNRREFVKKFATSMMKIKDKWGVWLKEKGLEGLKNANPNYQESKLKWLFNHRLFNHIRSLCLNGRIVHLHLDLTNLEAVSKVHSILNQHKGSRIIYISNVRDWVVERYPLMTSEQFNHRLSLLCNRRTVLISSKRGQADGPDAPQSVHRVKSIQPFLLEEVRSNSISEFV